MKPKYQKRYVLGEGYPWVQRKCLTTGPRSIIYVNHKWPKELKPPTDDMPKYRLELVRVDGKK